jgi:hypothetical protein
MGDRDSDRKMTDRSAAEADLSAIRTIPVARRPNKVRAEEFAHPPGSDRCRTSSSRAISSVSSMR